MKKLDLTNKSTEEAKSELLTLRKDSDLLALKLRAKTSNKTAEYKKMKKDIARLSMFVAQNNK
jgi:ribosomal protein L29